MSFLDYVQSPKAWEGAWHMGKSSQIDVVWMKNKASEVASEREKIRIWKPSSTQSPEPE